MDMQKEREAFDKWADDNIAKGRIMNWSDWCWEAWQAAQAKAVPEGFVLVPIETLDEALSWANCAASECWTDAQREEIDKHYEVIENAMIEAQEPK